MSNGSRNRRKLRGHVAVGGNRSGRKRTVCGWSAAATRDEADKRVSGARDGGAVGGVAVSDGRCAAHSATGVRRSGYCEGRGAQYVVERRIVWR